MPSSTPCGSGSRSSTHSPDGAALIAQLTGAVGAAAIKASIPKRRGRLAQRPGAGSFKYVGAWAYLWAKQQLARPEAERHPVVRRAIAEVETLARGEDLAVQAAAWLTVTAYKSDWRAAGLADPFASDSGIDSFQRHYIEQRLLRCRDLCASKPATYDPAHNAYLREIIESINVALGSYRNEPSSPK